MYRAFYRLLLSRFDAERSHRFGVWAIAWATPMFRAARRLGWLATPDPRGAVHTLGLTFPAPLGLAAGMDKNAQAVMGLAAAGFGFVEVGTVTPLAQPGNERPRSWRETDILGLRNRMGFNNEGAQAMAARLERMRSTRAGRDLVVGVNLGKNKTQDDAPADYATSARLLAPYASYLVVNVSSPNTPGLRDLQSVESLRPILTATREAALAAVPERRVPLLVKIAPDLADADVDAVAHLAVSLGLDGIIAGNTTIAHDRGPGGLSGPPLLPRAREIVARLRAIVGPQMCLIGVGGISSVEDARRMLAAGATLLQVYTAFVYQGPGWVAGVNRALTVPGAGQG